MTIYYHFFSRPLPAWLGTDQHSLWQIFRMHVYLWHYSWKCNFDFNCAGDFFIYLFALWCMGLFFLRVLWISSEIKILLWKFQQSTCWGQDLYEKCFVSCKNVCLPLIPFINLKKQVSSANPSWWVLGKWWADDGLAYATICRYSNCCLKKQAVGLHSYWEGYRNKLWGQKDCCDEKWLATEIGRGVFGEDSLIETYETTYNRFRSSGSCLLDLNTSLVWCIWNLGSRKVGGNCCFESYIVRVKEDVKLQGEKENAETFLTSALSVVSNSAIMKPSLCITLFVPLARSILAL